MVTPAALAASVSKASPPDELAPTVQALWWAAKGDWEKAHALIQAIDDKTAAHIHAYLHRKEGDQWNANYWYSKASRRMPGHTLEKEWEDLVKELL